MARLRPVRDWSPHISRMRPIDDFQIRYRSEPEDVTNPIVAPQPTHPRLRDLPWGVEENVALFFRGRIVPHLRPAGERIEAQFKTEHGYLLLISECEGVWFFFKTANLVRAKRFIGRRLPVRQLLASGGGQVSADLADVPGCRLLFRRYGRAGTATLTRRHC